MKLDSIQKEELGKELIKLADIMETCEPGSSELKSYNREYRKVAKLLYPELYQKKRILRKLSHKFAFTLTPCTCGNKSIRYTCDENGNYRFKCDNCLRESEWCETTAKTRDSWNATFNTIPNE